MRAPLLNPCAILGLFFTVAAVVMLIFVEISQISSGQKVPRSLRMVTLDTTNFANGIRAADPNANLTGLFASGFRNGDGTGIRNYYEWGLWAYCEASGKNNDADYCSGTSFGYGFRPADVLLSDVPAAQQTLVAGFLPNTTFIASSYLGTFSTVAFYLIFIGAILAGIAMVLSLIAHRFAYLIGAASSFGAFILVGVGATIWSIIIAKTRNGINSVTAADGTPLGLHVSWGDSLWVLWAACASLLFAVIPLVIACCTGGDRRRSVYMSEKDSYAGSAYRSSRYEAGTPGSQYAPSVRTSVRGSTIRY